MFPQTPDETPRSETLAVPDYQDIITNEGRRSGQRRRLSGGSFRMTGSETSSSGYGMDVTIMSRCHDDVTIEFESPSSLVPERPTTLPEVTADLPDNDDD